ncbi:MAG: magnesium/cobalt transporter CorA [Phycisphaerales bacterium]|nr:magnesium/cobalt transporter CorA [Phycisphaerales bacterium]
MFYGYVRYADGGISCLNSPAGLADAWASSDSVMWIDLESPTPEELRELNAIIKVDESAIEDCLSGEQRPRLDEFTDHIFLLLYGLRGIEKEEDDEIDPRKLAAFVSRRYLVTVHARPLLTISETRERCVRNPELILLNGVDELFYRIVDRVVDRYIEFTQAYEERIETLEEITLRDETDGEVLSEITDLRREFMELRQLAMSQRELLRPLGNGDLEYISPALEHRFRHVNDHLMQVIELTDALREQLLSVRDNYHTSIANRTNAVMQTLTIFASVMLPLTFVAGIYGMNLPLWPPQENPGSFWGVMGVMLAIAGAMLMFFRKKRWL